jgi:hypothetical protein
VFFHGAVIHLLSLKGERFLRPTPRMNYKIYSLHISDVVNGIWIVGTGKNLQTQSDRLLVGTFPLGSISCGSPGS